MKEAASQGATLMRRLLVRAGESIQRRSVLAPEEFSRRQFADAARTLMKHEHALCEAYPHALLTEFAHAIAGDTRKAGTVNFDSLQLMGEEQVRENVDQMRVLQAVKAQVEAELTDLNTLISSVQGLASVQPDRNPLRPDVYVRSLRSVVLQSPVPAPMRVHWMLHLGEALGPELARMYTELAGWMRSQGVTQARFNAHVVPEPKAAEAAGTQVLNFHELRKLVAGDVDRAERESVSRTTFSPTMPAAVDALENMKQVDLVVERMRKKQEAGAQALSHEVVRLMVENIASDARLLAPVQQCVRDLEPALMRLAHDDPRFFSDRDHPARQLLAELTQRSIAWESVDAPGFEAFFEPLRQAVEVLRETHVPGAGPFQFALATLEETWGEIEQRESRQREKAVRALIGAEQRNLLAQKVAATLRGRPDVVGAPAEMVAFLTGPWAQVIAHARLGDTTGSHDPGGYTSLITDLVWSSQPQLAGAQAQRLAKLVPPLVEKLRGGLATIGYPKAAADTFLHWFADTHEPVLARGELEAMLKRRDDMPGAWLAPDEAQESGFMTTDASLLGGVPFRSTSPGDFVDTRPPADDLSEVSTDLLQPGVWVEMRTPRGAHRLQVSWASPHGTLLMLTAPGGQPQSIERRSAGRMLREGSLRLISANAVVDEALDAVAETALRNTLL